MGTRHGKVSSGTPAEQKLRDARVKAAAYRALQSESPAQWRGFLETDIFLAAEADKS
ncbi:hypothetical protein ACFQ05_29375 [Amycolatopsis umgeniensis]|uniref:Uncharacterized protein n=1 Tax=Amycolatopsis umgeniensis TaxID=336628 RepID=A0A841BDN1_9PSEU|nr:hypothetical protein [Amycolatopsis umgeniensis]MBB5857011.1 hypothetical protein [Amycolatopsis umgeniensis]